jgi:hypothetical protein
MEFANIIINRVEDLSHMVDDMLDISKIEAGLLSVCRVRISATDIASGVLTTLERKAKASRALFEALIPAELPEIFCDPENIRRVIINLVVDACKFSGEGGKVVLWAKHDVGRNEFRFGVTDDGPGISPDHVEAIFERFRQIDTGLKASGHGFGLGLSIARELVSANFGSICVESEVGSGSTFEFTLPLADPATIAKKFVEYVPQLSPRSAFVCVLKLKLEQVSSAKDETERKIYEKLRRTDVIIPVDRGEWLICAALVAPEEAGQIVARLEEGLREQGTEHDCSLRIECCNVIALDRPADEVGALLWNEIEYRIAASRTLGVLS